MNQRIMFLVIAGIIIAAILAVINLSIGLGNFWEALSPKGLFIRFDQPLATPSAVTTVETSGQPPILTSTQPNSTLPPTTNTKTFSGEYVTFSYPFDWNVQALTPVDGAINEFVKLGIPGILGDQTLGFYGMSIEQVRPNDIKSEAKITVSGRTGYKWVRKGNNYVSYDYYAPGFADVGTFGIHVTVGAENKTLEQQLDQLVITVKY